MSEYANDRRRVSDALIWETRLRVEGDRWSAKIGRNILVGIACVDLVSTTVAGRASGES